VIAPSPHIEKQALTRMGAPGAAAVSAGTASTANATDKFIERGTTWAGGIGMAAMIVPGILKFFSGIVGWVGKHTKLEFVKKTADVIQKPAHILETTSLERAVGPSVVKGMGTVFESTAGAANFVAEQSGWAKFRGGLATNRTKNLLEGAITHIDRLEPAKAPVLIRQHLVDMRGHLEVARNTGVFNAAAVETLQKEIAKHNTGANKALKPYFNVTKKAGKMFGNAAIHNNTAEAYKNVSATVKSALSEMPKASIGTTVMNTGFVAASALATFGVARGVVQNYQSLRAMCADEKGKPVHSVGIFNVLFGKHSQPITDARKHFFALSGVQSTAEILGLTLTLLQVSKGNMSTGTLLKFMAPQIVAGGAASMIGASALPYYRNLKLAYASGKEIPVAAIAEFIGLSSKDLRERGGAESPFTQEIANQLRGLSPAEILKEIPNGITARVEKLIAAQKALHSEAPAVAVTTEPTVSFTDRLNGKKPVVEVKKPEKKVVGQYTANHNNELAKDVENTRGLS